MTVLLDGLDAPHTPYYIEETALNTLYIADPSIPSNLNVIFGNRISAMMMKNKNNVKENAGHVGQGWTEQGKSK